MRELRLHKQLLWHFLTFTLLSLQILCKCFQHAFVYVIIYILYLCRISKSCWKTAANAYLSKRSEQRKEILWIYLDMNTNKHNLLAFDGI